MRQKLRTTFLFIAALLMGFAAFVNASVVVPHLREDMIEINVRPTLLAALSLALQFGTFAMFAFALIVFVAAIKSPRGMTASPIVLGIIGVTYSVFGVFAFILSGSHHTLGYLAMGVLMLGAAAIRE